MSRKRFEQHFKGMPYCLSHQKNEDGGYASYAMKMAWEGWQAAMAYAQQVLLEEEMPLSKENLLEWPEENGEAFRRNVCNKLFEEDSPFHEG